MSLTAQQSQLFLQRFAESGLAHARELWHTPRLEHIQEVLRDFITWLIDLKERGKDFVVINLRVNNIVDQFIRFLKFESKEKVRDTKTVIFKYVIY